MDFVLILLGVAYGEKNGFHFDFDFDFHFILILILILSNAPLWLFVETRYFLRCALSKLILTTVANVIVTVTVTVIATILFLVCTDSLTRFK